MQGAMEGFVDIHHHLIYGMDDGAQTWEQTRQMLTSAWKNGIDRIIATPHAEPGMEPFPMEQLTRRIQKAQSWCDEQRMQMEILPGCEIFYTPQTVCMLREGLIPTLAGSNYVLVEFLPGAPYSELIGAAKTDSGGLSADFRAYRALQMFTLAGARSITAGALRRQHADERRHDMPKTFFFQPEMGQFYATQGLY